MQIWMAMDPRGQRVLVQGREVLEEDLPPYPRNRGWSKRGPLEVPDEEFQAILSGEITDGDTLNELHRGWWNAAGGDWPES